MSHPAESLSPEKINLDIRVDEQPTVVELNVEGTSYHIALPDVATDYIQKRIAQERQPYEAEMLSDMRRRLDPDSLALDVGANIGNHTLYLAAISGCHIVAFEPNRHLCGALLSSIEINGFSERVQVRALALGAAEGSGHFAQELPDNLGAQRIELGAGEIQVAALDSFDFARTVRVLKIDVEGMELDVLRGARNLLRINRPALYVECITAAEFRAVAGWLEGLDYCYWDTFNATPTHLFLPTEGLSIDQRIARLQYKVAQDDYRTSEQLIQVRKKLDEANLKYRSAIEQISTLKQRVTQEESARKHGETAVSQLQQQLKQTEQLLQEARTQEVRTKDRIDHETANYRDTVTRLETEVQALRDRLSDAQEVSRLNIELLNTEQEQLKQAKLDRDTAEQTISRLTVQLALAEHSVAQTNAQLTSAEQRIESERLSRRLDIERLDAAIETERESRHNAELRLARLDAEHSAVTARLEEANHKYRSVNEQVVSLKERVREAELSVFAQTQELGVLRGKLDAVESAHALALREREVEAEHRKRDVEELSQQIVEFTAVRKELQSSLDEAKATLLSRSAQITSLEDALAATKMASQETFSTKERETETLRSALQSRINDIEGKLRESIERSQSLDNQLIEARASQEVAEKLIHDREEELRASEAAIVGLREQLDNATQGQEASQARLESVVSELETTRALRRGEQHQSEQLKLQVLQTKRALADLQSKLESLRQQKVAAENQIVKTRGMISFQLGYALLNGFKSFRGMLALPGQLLAIDREAKRRKSAKTTTATLLEAPKTKPARSPVQNLVSGREAPEHAAYFSLPDSGFVQALKSLKVACIMDEFTFSSYRPECNLLQLSVHHWQSELETFTPELLFIESAWRGKDEQWGSKVGHMSEELVGIINWCRQHKIPSVFWNKEDPVHFETFLNTAKLFDYVFTTDIDCIHRYKAALGHNRVYLLPFACQPEFSNPIETYQRKDAFCFAGAYYVRYPERTRDLGNFMSALAEYRPVEIYDRNHGKHDPNYQFPVEYQPFIVGSLPFDQIDKAYKGYRYAINLNSIKQSQTMFARRVFELLASNTVTVSNFSRGVRLLFGDLVITTDNGSEVVRRLQALGGDDVEVRKFRLAGLRKVMSEHTYRERFAYVVSKVQGKAPPSLLPTILVTAYAKDQDQFDALRASINRQSYADRRFVVVVPGGFVPEGVPADGSIEVLSAKSINELTLGELAGSVDLIAGMVSDDYYGPNYLIDLALATRYSSARGIGKLTHHVWSAESGLTIAFPGCQYRSAKSLPARSSLVYLTQVAEMALRDWVIGLHTSQIDAADLLSIDEFNYCKNGGMASFDATQASLVDDLIGLDQGLSADEIIIRAERIAPEEVACDETPSLTGEQLAAYFRPPTNKGYSLTVSGSGWEAESTLGDGTHEYLYAATDLRPADLGFESQALFHLDASPGLNLQLVMFFLDAQKQRISHVIKSANRNHDVAIPVGTEWIRLGLRIYGGGAARINALVLGHRPLRPAEVLGCAQHLILTNHYPSYDDLYRNGFVHSRVAAYAARGTRVDVFRLRNGETLSYHEFHNVDVITGSQEALNKLLIGGQYKSVLVHFLDENMWEVLQHHIGRVKVFVWVHGAEIQPWHRRDYNFANDQEREAAKAQSELRMTFWRELLEKIPENLKLIFVSNYFAEEVMEDLGFRLPKDSYEIIHNPIDTDLFAYQEKPIEQRRKILSIRPYASRKYANDVSVKAILALSQEPFFNDLEFRLIGDGKLFDETLEPVRRFSNVYIERRFLTHAEIAALHREYGIFLCPTRMDAQGVSRDEAMSSGLVPVTNGVTAIPEFVDDECGVLAGSEDHLGMARGIALLYQTPEKFLAMSKAAALRVREQSDVEKIINLELSILGSTN